MDTVNEFDARIDALEIALKPFLDGNLDEIMSDLDDEETAKLNIVLAFAMNSLYFMFLKTQGASPANHPVTKELSRIQGYIKKLKTASTQKASNAEAAEKLIDDVKENDDNDDEPDSSKKEKKKEKKSEKKSKKKSRDEQEEEPEKKKKKKGSKKVKK